MLTTQAPNFDQLRVREFARLDMHNQAYLDYTGAALYAASQVEVHHAQLINSVFGNPHSEHEPSRLSETEIDDARADVLAFLGVDHQTHAVIFTANTTAAIKLVAESFSFGPRSPLVVSADNHNSVNGLREYATRAGAPIVTLALDDELRLDEPHEGMARLTNVDGGLLAFPAQSNFSGVQHDLGLVEQARRLGFTVLIDAAAYLAANRLDLRDTAADFVALSFYKLFGYPTGIGALVVRRDALPLLRRPWFSGGTVDFVSIQLGRHQLRDGAAAFEDGTPNFLGIPAVRTGLKFLSTLGMDAIHRHVCTHAHIFLNGLAALKHGNGEPVVDVYGPGCAPDRGATIAFNVRDAYRRTVPYPVVEARAREKGVALRGGCFCNPGAAEAAFGFDPAETARCLGLVQDRFTIERYAACLGDFATVGALRASFGVPTNARDVARALDVIASFAAD